MIFYKLIRYLCFLLLLTITSLYFLKGVNIPYLTAFYQKIDTVYQEIPLYFEEQDSDDIPILLEKNSLQLLQDPYQIIDAFWSDISTEFALISALDRNFDNLEYLISEYLVHYPFFRDLILYSDNKVAYKYNKRYPSSTFSFLKYQLLRNQEIRVEFVFDLAILQAQVNKLQDLVFVSYNSQVFYPNKYEDIDLAFIDDILQYKNVSESRISLSRGTELYIDTIEKDIQIPLKTFMIQQYSFRMGSFMQILFILLFPLLWLLFIVMDRMIYKLLCARKTNNEHQNYLANMTDISSDKENLEWFDQFIKLESAVEQEIEQNSREENDKKDNAEDNR